MARSMWEWRPEYGDFDPEAEREFVVEELRAQEDDED